MRVRIRLRRRVTAATVAITASAMALVTAAAPPAAAIVPAGGGTPLIWGDGRTELIGTGTDVITDTPQVIPALPAGVTQVAFGGEFAAALASDGSVTTWGDNIVGELGDGSDASGTGRDVPGRVPSLTGVTQLALGFETGAALRSDGTVWTWGNGNGGQLGDGTSGMNVHRDVPGPVPGLTGVVQIAATDFAVLALRADGTVWAWGENADGELGDGGAEASLHRDVPGPVPGLAGVVQVAGGSEQVLAITSNGNPLQNTVWTWGHIPGTDPDDPSQALLTPTPVAGLTGVVQASVGVNFDLAVQSDGTIRAWGDNNAGQLGDGSAGAPSLTPVEVTDIPADVVEVAAGWDHGLARTAGGVVFAWGDDVYGELGDGLRTQEDEPVYTGIANAASIATGPTRMSAAVTAPPAIGMWVSPSRLTVNAGTTATVGIGVREVPGPGTLSMTGLPLGTSALLLGSTLAAGLSDPAGLQLKSSLTTPPGNFSLNFTASATGPSGPVTVSRAVTGTIVNPSYPNCVASFAPARPVTIPDNDTTLSTAATMPNCPSPPLAGTARVQVRINHPHRGDLTIVLVSPAGASYLLRAADSGEIGNNIDTVYQITIANRSWPGASRWHLLVNDEFPGNRGTLISWAVGI